MGFDFEGAGPAIANINNARILARPLYHAPAVGWEAAQVHPRGLVRTMLAPHHAKNAQLRDGRFPAQKFADLVVFLGGEPVLFDNFGRDGGSQFQHGFVTGGRAFLRKKTNRDIAVQDDLPGIR